MFIVYVYVYRHGMAWHGNYCVGREPPNISVIQHS